MFNFPRQAAAYLKERINLTAEEEDIARYSLELIFYGAITIMATVLMGWLLRCLPAVLTIMLASFIFRSFSGGAHSATPLGCTLVSMVTVPLLGKGAVLAAPYFTELMLLLLIGGGFLLALTVTWRLAPVDSPAKPITSLRHRQQLRLLAIVFLFLVLIIQCILFIFVPAPQEIILAAEAGILWQVFTLTRSGHRLAAVIDKMLLFKPEGGETK